MKRARLRAALRGALLLVGSFGHGAGGGDLIDFRRRSERRTRRSSERRHR